MRTVALNEMDGVVVGDIFSECLEKCIIASLLNDCCLEPWFLRLTNIMYK